MEIEKSRNGFYTVTFENDNFTEEDIEKLFGIAGKVCSISISKTNRAFVRFRYKNEAEQALKKFSNSLNVEMALNIKRGSESKDVLSKSQENIKKSDISLTSPEPIKATSLEQNHHLILGNLPKTYDLNDIENLVKETNPLSITDIDETDVFHSKFCHIVLDTEEKLLYLIEKLHNFCICGHKLIALEAKALLEWNKSFMS